jgi:hypothetical protein
MIRSLLFGLALALGTSVVAWLIIPAPTYVENALGILMAVFVVTMVIGVLSHRAYVSRRRHT